MDRTYENLLLADYHGEKDNYVVKYRLDAVNRGMSVARLVGTYTTLKGKRVLEIGCGDGGISIAFAKHGCEVYGLDYEPHAISLARVRARDVPQAPKFYVGDAHDLGVRDNIFDIVICNDLLEHVRSVKRIAKQVFRVLKSEGLVFLSFSNICSFLNFISDPHHHLFGISILPRSLAEFYVTKIRRKTRHYGVEKLLSYWRVQRIFNDLSIDLELIPDVRWKEKLENPELVVNTIARRAFRLLKKIVRLETIKLLIMSKTYLCFVHPTIYMIGKNKSVRQA